METECFVNCGYNHKSLKLIVQKMLKKFQQHAVSNKDKQNKDFILGVTIFKKRIPNIKKLSKKKQV